MSQEGTACSRAREEGEKMKRAKQKDQGSVPGGGHKRERMQGQGGGRYRGVHSARVHMGRNSSSAGVYTGQHEV